MAFARDIGLEPVVIAGKGEGAMPTVRHPIIYSATPPSYPLPPPALDEHGAQIRAWLAGPPGPLAAPGDTAAAPGDTAAAPGDTTAAPGDTAAAHQTGTGA